MREIKTTNTALEQQKKQSEAVATAQKGLKKDLMQFQKLPVRFQVLPLLPEPERLSCLLTLSRVRMQH